jgi:hypothetical protein
MKLGWSNFATAHHSEASGNTYFKGSPDVLLNMVYENWDKRKPGNGRNNLDQVVVVPIPADTRFIGKTVKIHKDQVFRTMVEHRQEHESPYLKTEVIGWEDFDGKIIPEWPDLVKFVSVVLYSAATLLENNGERSGDYDWEIVALIASDVENEPMHPLTMARNMLDKPGGTHCDYTAEQFAESIWYWSTRATVARK